MAKTKQKLEIKLLILDVDGVLTDGKLYMSNDGGEAKSFHVRDNLGLKMLLKNGIEVAVISGRKSNATEKRMKDAGVKYIYQGVADKIKIFNKLKSKLKIENKNIAYIGDDIPDLEVMQEVGFAVAVADAIPEVRKIANYVTKATGGNGAVREVCDLIL